MSKLIELYFLFFKISLSTFGGGLIILPLLQREISDNKKWLSKEQVIDYYALSQVLPGLVSVNVAGFVGYKIKKLPGALFAMLGVSSPSVIIITVVAAYLTGLLENPLVRRAFDGVALAVTALILHTVIGLWKNGVKDKMGVIIFVAVFCFMFFTNVSPVIYVLSAAALGLIYKKFKGGEEIND